VAFSDPLNKDSLVKPGNLNKYLFWQFSKNTRGILALLLGLIFIFCVVKVSAQEIPFDPNATTPDDGSTAPPSAPPPPANEPTSGSGPSPQVKPGKKSSSDFSSTLDDGTAKPSTEDLPPPPPPQITTGQAPAAPATPPPSQAEAISGTKAVKPAELAGLGNLAPFSDIAVISKRFLPKTHRFEFFPNFGLVVNDAFFSDIVFGARLAYSFTETLGVEVNGMSISASNKSVTTELQALNPPVLTAAIASPTSFYGIDFKWSPIYGKMSFMNRTIVPFDTYFSAGGGMTGTNQGTSAASIHVGVGQLFAVSKWLAARWDISYYGFNTTSTVNNSAGFFNTFDATIGMSFFFPGATYR
jgi:outer membrane beta-barrel protein